MDWQTIAWCVVDDSVRCALSGPPVEQADIRAGEFNTSFSFTLDSHRIHSVRIYGIDVSRPDADVEFLLCAFLDFPFELSIMELLGDRLCGWGYIKDTPIITLKALWDYKSAEFVAWVKNGLYDSGRTVSPSPPFLP